MEKKVSGTRLKPWQAILLILAVAAFLFVAQFVLTGLQFLLDRSGLLQGDTAYTVASVLYWLLGGIAALYVLRNYILCYQYVWNTKQLSVFRLYGAGRPRNMVDIYFSKLLAVDSVEQLRARYPQAKLSRATLKRCPEPVHCIAYNTLDGVRLLALQPGEELLQALQEQLKSKK